MFIVWGSVSGTQDLGVVAELCPWCREVTACQVSGQVQGMHLFFIPLAGSVGQSACTCGRCGNRFACESWRYKTMLSVAEALTLPLESLLERTNPALKEKLESSRHRERFRDDPRYEETSRSLDELRPGSLKSRLTTNLRSWAHLTEHQRESLAHEATGSAQAMLFAKWISCRIPTNAGCAIGALTCLVVCAGLLVLVFLWEGDWIAAGSAILVGLLIGARVYQFALSRSVRRWTQEVLVPEGRKSGIDFSRFAAILEDLPPPGPRSRDNLSLLQEQAGTIRTELALLDQKKASDGHWDGP